MSLFTPLEIEFLLAHRVGRLATVSASGQPHVVPTIYHFADGVFRIGARALEGRGQGRVVRTAHRGEPEDRVRDRRLHG